MIHLNSEKWDIDAVKLTEEHPAERAIIGSLDGIAQFIVTLF